VTAKNPARINQLIAEYGATVRDPLCQAAVALWDADREHANYAEEAKRIRNTISATDRLAAEVAELQKRFHTTGKLAQQAEAKSLARKVLKLKMDESKSLQLSLINLCISAYWRDAAQKTFAESALRAIRRSNFTAFATLKRARSAWIERSAGYKRHFLTLRYWNEQRMKKALKEGGLIGAFNLLRGDDRYIPLFTAAQLHNYLVHNKVFSTPRDEEARNEQLRQVRRIAAATGVQLLQEKRGRKSNARGSVKLGHWNRKTKT
jgi:hypothetical protein